MKIQIRFVVEKKFRFVFNENIDHFVSRKNLDLYLVKIQICFVTRKEFRSVFNENTNQF